MQDMKLLFLTRFIISSESKHQLQFLKNNITDCEEDVRCFPLMMKSRSARSSGSMWRPAEIKRLWSFSDLRYSSPSGKTRRSHFQGRHLGKFRPPVSSDQTRLGEAKRLLENLKTSCKPQAGSWTSEHDVLIWTLVLSKARFYKHMDMITDG